jgi:hypothetical protein
VELLLGKSSRVCETSVTRTRVRPSGGQLSGPGSRTWRARMAAADGWQIRQCPTNPISSVNLRSSGPSFQSHMLDSLTLNDLTTLGRDEMAWVHRTRRIVMPVASLFAATRWAVETYQPASLEAVVAAANDFARRESGYAYPFA